MPVLASLTFGADVAGKRLDPPVKLLASGSGSFEHPGQIIGVLAAPTPKTYARTDTSIWLLGLGRDPQHRIVRRVDDGGVTGKKDYRYEPETSSGPGEIFVYYTVDKLEPGRPAIHGLHRYRTGIFASNDRN